MPWSITIDDKDNVWVADWRNHRIQKLTLEGDFLASLGSSGDLPGQFSKPSDIAVDGEGDVYVTDWLNCWQPAKVKHFETREIRGRIEVS